MVDDLEPGPPEHSAEAALEQRRQRYTALASGLTGPVHGEPVHCAGLLSGLLDDVYSHRGPLHSDDLAR